MSPWASGDSLTPSTLNSKVPSWFTNRTAMFNVVDYGADPTGATDSSSAIDLADAAAVANAPLSGGVVVFPEGSYKVASALTYRGAPWVGAGRTNTQLVVTSATTGIDAVGSSASRRVVSITGMTLDGSQSGNSAVGLALGWNQRSLRATDDLYITGFGGPGILFADQNWIVNFYSTFINACGNRISGGNSGVSNTAAAAAALLNINAYGLLIENCGKVGSGVGGGINLNGVAQFGLYGGCLEDNIGAAEAQFIGSLGIGVFGTYFEGTSLSTASSAVLFDGTQFALHGCHFTTGAANTAKAVRAINASVGVVDGGSIDPRWLGGVIAAEGTSRIVASGVSLSAGTLVVAAGASLTNIGSLNGDVKLSNASVIAPKMQVTGAGVAVYVATSQGTADWCSGAAADGTFAIAPDSTGQSPVVKISSTGAALVGTGTTVAPSQAFLSEASLGFYRSAASTIRQSFGTLDLTQANLSLKTTAVSQTSLTIPDGGFQLYIGGTSGATLAARSGGTIYFFASSSSTKG